MLRVTLRAGEGIGSGVNTGCCRKDRWTTGDAGGGKRSMADCHVPESGGGRVNMGRPEVLCLVEVVDAA